MPFDEDNFETLQVEGSLQREGVHGYSFYIDGKENIEIRFMNIGFKSKEQVDRVMNQLLDLRNTLKK